MLGKQDPGHDQRPDGGPKLVHELIKAKDPAGTDLLTGKGKHGFNRWFSKSPSGALGNDKSRSHGPMACQGHGRNCQHVDGIANQDKDPILMGFTGEKTCEGAQAISDQFPKSGNESDGSSAGPQARKKGAIDAPAPP